MAKYDWKSIRREYETTNISQRDLCEKHNIPYSTLCQKSMKDKWYKDKKIEAKIEARIEAKIEAKIEKESEKIAENKVNNILEAKRKQQEISDMAINIIKEAMNYKKGFYTEKVKIRTGHGKGCYDENLEEIETNQINSSFLEKIMKSLEIAQKVQDNAIEYLSPDVRQKIENDKKQIEQKERELENKINSNKIIDNDNITINFGIPRPKKDDEDDS